MECKINNKYIVQSVIGEGKFGKIYKGYNIKTQEPVAIKLEDKYGAHNYHPLPVVLSKGEGFYVWDV